MKTKLILLFLLGSFTAFAQQDAQFSQYMLNTVNINPAYAGSRGALSFFGLHRSQWVGLDGAPKTNAFSVNSPITNTRLGIGATYINDKIGPINSNALSADLSYTINVSYKYLLSFGIKATGNLFSLDASRLRPSDENDFQIQSIKSNFSPNFGAGVYLHNDHSYIGLSVRNLLTTKVSNTIETYKERLNYNLIAGYVFDIDDAIKFKPAVLIKAVSGAPLQADVSANFLLADKLTLGVAYRWSAAVNAMAGYQISKGLYLGYGYDFDTTALGGYNSGSHEVFLRFEIFNDNSRITAPRFF